MPESSLAAGFLRWQSYPYLHSLTCSGGGGPGDHQTDLELANDWGDAILLRCPTCGYTQRVEAAEPFGQLLSQVQLPPVRELLALAQAPVEPPDLRELRPPDPREEP